MIRVAVDSVPADGYLEALVQLIERRESLWRSASQPIITDKAIWEMQQLLRAMEIPSDVARLVARLGEASARNTDLRTGFSLRALTDLLRASGVLAASRGRATVSTADVIRMSQPVLSHRILLTEGAVNSGMSEELVMDEIIKAASSGSGQRELGRSSAASRQQRANLQKAMLRRLHRTSTRLPVEELVETFSDGSVLAGITSVSAVYEAITSLVEWGMVELDQVNGLGEGNQLAITLLGREAVEDRRTPFEFYSSRSSGTFEWQAHVGDSPPHIWSRISEPVGRPSGSDSLDSSD